MNGLLQRARATARHASSTLPSGRGITTGAWTPRHRALLAVLWLHAIGLTAFAIARGVGILAVTWNGVALFTLAAIASSDRVQRRTRVGVTALGLGIAAGFLLQIANGATDARFYLFVMLGILTLYEDWIAVSIPVAYAIGHDAILRRFDLPAILCAAALAIALLAASIAIERTRSRSKDLLASMSEGILAVDARRKIAYANAAAVRAGGWPELDLLRMPLDSVLRPRPDRPGPPAEGYLRRADGKEVAIEWTEAPLQGEPGSRIITFRETARRREAERQLEAARLQLARSEKLTAVGQLVSGVAHEIRTPLTYLETNLYLLQRKLDEGSIEGTEEHMQSALEAADRINRLVEDLRRYSKLRPGARDTIALHEAVQEAVNLFAATHRAHVRVRTALLPTPPAPVDRVQVQQIVLNLMQNAAEAMPKGGTIHVQTMMHGGNAVIAVEDEGRGVPQEIRDRIYDPFFTTKTEGTGLGLSIVKRLVEEHRGTIACETRHGGGTRFEVTLPLPHAREITVREDVKRPILTP